MSASEQLHACPSPPLTQQQYWIDSKWGLRFDQGKGGCMHSCSGTDIDFPLFSRIILNLILIISLKIVFSHAVVSGSNFQSFTTAERQ